MFSAATREQAALPSATAQALDSDQAANRIEDHVRPDAAGRCANRIRPPLRRVGDRRLCAKLPADRQLLLRSHGCDHAAAMGQSDLRCRAARPACRRVDEQRLAGADVRAMMQGVVSGRIVGADEPARFLRGLIARRTDRASNLDAGRKRRLGVTLVEAARHQRFGEIHAGRLDAHDIFVRAGNRVRALDPRHLAGVRDPFDEPATHQRASPLTIRASAATIRSPAQMSGLISISETSPPASAASSENRQTISASRGTSTAGAL